jgi:cell division protein FtsL
MSYRAEALDLGALEQETGREKTTFTPWEGGSLDARARREASPLLRRVAIFLTAVVLALFAAGGMSVALTSGTVGLLRENAKTASHIKELRTQNDDLRIERSQLVGNERISRIATQNLGMVYASDAMIIDVESE